MAGQRDTAGTQLARYSNSPIVLPRRQCKLLSNLSYQSIHDSTCPTVPKQMKPLISVIFIPANGVWKSDHVSTVSADENLHRSRLPLVMSLALTQTTLLSQSSILNFQAPTFLFPQGSRLSLRSLIFWVGMELPTE